MAVFDVDVHAAGEDVSHRFVLGCDQFRRQMSRQIGRVAANGGANERVTYVGGWLQSETINHAVTVHVVICGCKGKGVASKLLLTNVVPWRKETHLANVVNVCSIIGNTFKTRRGI